MGRRAFATVAAACLVAAIGGTVVAARLRPGHTSADAGTVVAVTERNFEIAAPAQIGAGDVRLRVENRGPDRHEIVVVRRSDGRELPIREDGLTLDEDALEPTTVGILEPGEPGSIRDLDVRLAPGRYELFCNMSGHYLGGMHTEMVVRP